MQAKSEMISHDIAAMNTHLLKELDAIPQETTGQTSTLTFSVTCFVFFLFVFPFDC